MQKFKKILIVAIICLFSFNLNSKASIYTDSLVASGGGILVLESEYKKYHTLLNILVSIKKKKNLSLFTLNDLVLFKMQVSRAKKLQINPNIYSVRSLTEGCPVNKNTTMRRFENFLKMYNLRPKHLNVFVRESDSIDQFHEKTLDEKITFSRDDLQDFLKHSNACDISETLFRYKIAKIHFASHWDDKIDLKNIKNVISFLRFEDFEKNMVIYLDNHHVWLDVYIEDYHIYQEEEDQLDIYPSNGIVNEILGPFYIRDDIILAKVMQKVYDIDRKGIRIKLGFINVKKKTYGSKIASLEKDKLKIKQLNRLRKRIKNGVIRNLKVSWLDDLKISSYDKEYLKSLNTNDVSRVIESPECWYVFKILYKDFDLSEEPNESLSLTVKREKFLKLRKSLINNLTKKNRIKRFNEKKVKKEFESKFSSK